MNFDGRFLVDKIGFGRLNGGSCSLKTRLSAFKHILSFNRGTRMDIFSILQSQTNFLAGDCTDDVIELIKSQTTWGEIELTDAVRPRYLNSPLKRGFCEAACHLATGSKIYQALVINETRRKLFPLFLRMFQDFHQYGAVQVFVELSLADREIDHLEWQSPLIETTLVEEALKYFRHLLLHDGYLTLRITHNGAQGPLEICLDEHKILSIIGEWGTALEPFKKTLRRRGLVEIVDLETILSAYEHMHFSDDSFDSKLEEFLDQIQAEIVT